MFTAAVFVLIISLSLVQSSVINSEVNHKVYTKCDWGGKERNNFIKYLTHPAEYVIIFHTAGSLCKDHTRCSSSIQHIQNLQMLNLKYPDIGYNFLIGGDGNIYTGRGWNYVNHHKDRSIAISYTGNFVLDKLTPNMVSALKYLLDVGVRLEKLPANYKLVGHNQTAATLSPGENVYREISKFPNFYNGPIYI